MSQNDPTDHALAAIASILDQPQSLAGVEKPAPEFQSAEGEVEEAEGYSKSGPGPLAAMRFKWTVRRENHGEYFVDETVGEGSRPIATGPMSKDAAVRLVDERSDEAQRRFEQIKNEMSARRTEQ